MNNVYIYAQIHQGHLIGIVKDKTGFTFHILLPNLVEEADEHYLDLETALEVAIKQVEKDCRWLAGFWAYEQGEPLPEIADLDFICGCHEGQQAIEGRHNATAKKSRRNRSSHSARYRRKTRDFHPQSRVQASLS